MNRILPVPLLVRFLLVLVLAAAVYFFSGFLVPVLAALIIGFASWPLYDRLVKRMGGKTILAASLSLLLILTLLVIPLSIALYYAISEASNFVAWLIMANRDGVFAPNWVQDLPLVGATIASYWTNTWVSRKHLASGWRFSVGNTWVIFTAWL